MTYTTFDVGDVVRVNYTPSAFHGKEGTIIDRLGDGSHYLVSFGERDSRWFSAASMLHVDPTPETLPEPPDDKPALTKTQKGLATTRLRGETLLRDGYKISLKGGGLFLVYPPGDKPPYEVWVAVDPDTKDAQDILVQCSCPAFDIHQECKHAIAIATMVRHAIQVVLNLEEIQEKRNGR